jgi:septum formation inhibitor MinC
MNLLSEIVIVVNKINELHPEDPKIYEYWERLADLLSENENATILLLNELDSEDIVENLSSVFDDVSKNLQSRDFILCLESLQNRYKNLEIAHMVQAAKDALTED